MESILQIRIFKITNKLIQYMKGQGGGGTAKGGGKSRSGGGSVVVKTVTVKKDKKCQQVEDNGDSSVIYNYTNIQRSDMFSI